MKVAYRKRRRGSTGEIGGLLGGYDFRSGIFSKPIYLFFSFVYSFSFCTHGLGHRASRRLRETSYSMSSLLHSTPGLTVE
jgi:hypothetical protein